MLQEEEEVIHIPKPGNGLPHNAARLILPLREFVSGKDHRHRGIPVEQTADQVPDQTWQPANQAADQAKAQQVRAVGDVAKSMKMTADQTPTAKVDGAMFTDALKNETTQKTAATPKVSLTKLSESAEVRDLIQTLKQGDSNEAVLRVEDTEAGNLEVHIRLDGADLAVQIRAEDVGLRRTMLDRFSSLESALASEGLVDGKVQVSEYDMGSSDSGTQSESKEEFNQKAGTQNQSGNGSDREVSQESSIHDGLVHVVA